MDKDWRPKEPPWDNRKYLDEDYAALSRNAAYEAGASAIVVPAALEGQKELAKELTKDFGDVDLIDKVALWDWLREKGLL